MKAQRVTPVLVALCLSLSSSSASAQDDEGLTEFQRSLLTSSLLPMAAGTSVAGLSTTGGLLLNGLLKGEESREKKTREVQAYLRENRHHLLQDMAVGGGDVFGDLATLWGVSPAYLELFERALLMERAHLTVLLSGDDVSLDGTLAWMDRLAARLTLELERAR